MKKLSRMLLLALSIALVASSAHATGTLGPKQVVDDALGDNVTTEDVSPAAGADLVAGFISETDAALNLTWKLASLALPSAVPQPYSYYYEFSLTAPDGSTGMFSARAVLTPTAGTGGANPTYPSGRLQGNCTTTGTLVTCVTIPGSQVTVSVDSANSTVTASLRRSDLKGADGSSLAVDGAQFEEAKLFRGITACMTTPAVTPGAACDDGDLIDTYTLGSVR